MSSSSSALSSLSSLLGDSSSGSGVDLSSILAATTGNTAAIDVTSAVEAAVYAARAPERGWQTDQTTLSSETSAIQSIQTATQAVETDLNSLNDITGPLSSRTVTSSTSAVTASAASGTAAGNHTISVSNLAATGSWYSIAESSATAALPSASITINTAAGASQTFATGSGNPGDTLNDLASAINAASLGVTASVVNDASGSRLAIIANNSGAAADFTVTSGSGFSFTRAATGTDASLTVDGIPVQSATNTVTGAIPGVTLNLLGTTTGTASIQVATDTTSVSNAINQFVSDYNTAIGLVNTQFTVGSNGTEGVLASDTTITNLQLTLQQGLNYFSSANGGSTTTTVNGLNDLGITENTDGSLSVDTTTLNNAITTNPTDVQNFFQGSSLNGFAATFSTALNSYLDPTTGAFTVDLNGINTQNTDLTNEINDFETNYITNLQTNLTTEYNNAEAALQSLPTQLKQIQAELGNNSGSSS